MEQIIRIGMDTSKHVFQLHGVNAAEQPVLRRKMRRKEMVDFFAKCLPSVIAIEACGASHHWVRLLKERLKEIEAKLMAWYQSDECCRRLATIPGVRPIGAVLLVMKAPAPEQFISGRQFAAWMGLTPRDHSTADKVRPCVITRAGDEILRKTLVVRATSLLRQVRVGRGRNASPWLICLLQRKLPKLGAVALANKIARIAWKKMMSGEAYKNTAARPVAACAA